MSSKLERGLQETSRELINWQSVGKERIAEGINQFLEALPISAWPYDISGRINISTFSLPPSSPKKEIIDALSENNGKGEVSLSFLPEAGVASCLFVINGATGVRTHICGSVNHQVEFIETAVTEYRPLGGSLQKYTPYEKFRTARRLIGFLQRDFKVD